MRLLLQALASLTVAACAAPTLRFVCDENTSNDLLAAAKDHAKTSVHKSLASALDAADDHDGLIVLADRMKASVPGVPQHGTTVNISTAQLEQIRAKHLRAYIEFPGTDPISGMHLPVQQTMWERVVVNKTSLARLAPLDLLHPHKYVDYVSSQPLGRAFQRCYSAKLRATPMRRLVSHQPTARTPCSRR